MQLTSLFRMIANSRSTDDRVAISRRRSLEVTRVVLQQFALVTRRRVGANSRYVADSAIKRPLQSTRTTIHDAKNSRRKQNYHDCLELVDDEILICFFPTALLERSSVIQLWLNLGCQQDLTWMCWFQLRPQHHRQHIMHPLTTHCYFQHLLPRKLPLCIIGNSRTRNSEKKTSFKKTCLEGNTLILHLTQSWPTFAQLLPDFHFLLHFGHLNSPKQRFLPWYGVRPSSRGVACQIKRNEFKRGNTAKHLHAYRCAARRRPRVFGVSVDQRPCFFNKPIFHYFVQFPSTARRLSHRYVMPSGGAPHHSSKNPARPFDFGTAHKAKGFLVRRRFDLQMN